MKNDYMNYNMIEKLFPLKDKELKHVRKILQLKYGRRDGGLLIAYNESWK